MFTKLVCIADTFLFAAFGVAGDELIGEILVIPVGSWFGRFVFGPAGVFVRITTDGARLIGVRRFWIFTWGASRLGELAGVVVSACERVAFGELLIGVELPVEARFPATKRGCETCRPTALVIFTGVMKC